MLAFDVSMLWMVMVEQQSSKNTRQIIILSIEQIRILLCYHVQVLYVTIRNPNNVDVRYILSSERPVD